MVKQIFTRTRTTNTKFNLKKKKIYMKHAKRSTAEQTQAKDYAV